MSMTVTRLEEMARTGRMTRRELLERSLMLGLSTPVVLGLLALAPESAGAAPATDPRGRFSRLQGDPTTLTIGIYDGIVDADPHSTYTTYGAMLAIGVYEMLVQYRGDSISEIEPMLAESYEANADNTSFTFKLPAGVTFHDGSPCDSSTVKAAFTRLIRQEMGPYLIGARFIDDPDAQIQTPDPTTVVFTTARPEPLFLAAMASSYGVYVTSPTDVEANKTDADPWAHEWFVANANGTGPYRLVENNFKERVVLEKFDGYHRGFTGTEFTTVVMRVVPENATRRQLIENGELDILSNALTEEDHKVLETNPDLRVVRYPTTRVIWLILNAVTLSVDARKALCYAFPYDEVINGVYLGNTKRTGPIPDNVIGYDPEVFIYPTDIEEARTLLASGGLVEGTTLSFMADSQSEESRLCAELFQSSLANLGITLDIQVVDYSILEETVYGDQPAEEKPHIMGLWSWWPDYNDGANQLEPNYTVSSSGGGGSNAGYYNNARFEEIMAEVPTADETTYLALMKEAQDILVRQDPASIFIGQREYTTVMRKDIQGFVPNPIYLEQYFLQKLSRAKT